MVLGKLAWAAMERVIEHDVLRALALFPIGLLAGAVAGAGVVLAGLTGRDSGRWLGSAAGALLHALLAAAVVGVAWLFLPLTAWYPALALAPPIIARGAVRGWLAGS